MPIATVQLPNGKIADIEVPQGATPQEIESFVMSQPEFAQQPAAPQAPEAPQQPIQPTQEPQSFQERNRDRITNFAKGVPQGLGNAAIGGVQAATDIGESAARMIEKLYFGDNVGQQNFGDRLASGVKNLREQQAQLPMAERAGMAVGEIAPYLAVGRGRGLVAGGALSGAVSSALSPQEEAGLKSRAVATAGGAAVGAVAAPVIGKAVNLVSNAPSATKELLKKAVGFDAEKVAKFADAGLDPTLANISKYRPISQLQNFLSATPGASARIERVIQHQVDNVAKKTIEIAGSKGGTIEQAGGVISSGAKSYKNMLGKRANAIYEDVYSQVPKDTNIALDNFKNLVSKDTDFQESAATSSFLKTKLDRLNSIMSPADSEVAPSIQRIKSIRSSIGKDLNSPSLTGDERGALKKIYGSLSADLKDGVLSYARNNYSEDAAVKLYGKFNAADSIFKVQQDFIKKTITPLEKAKTPDKIYSIATSNIKSGGVQIDNIFRTLNEEQKAFTRGSLINRMGKAPQSVQDETGNVFSLSKFRQDFNSLSKEAKEAIFTPKQLSSYNQLIKATSEIERTGRLGKINSATAQAVGWAGLTGAVLSPYLTAPAAAGMMAGTRITAGMMTNPSFVSWLAKQSSVSTVGGVQNSIARLGAIALSSDPSTRDDILHYMGELAGTQDSKAADDTENMTEEQIRNQLIQRQQQEPLLMDGIDPAVEAQKIKKRYYR